MEDKLKRVLLVEDNTSDVEMVLRALSDYNLANEVAVASDSDEAIDYLDRKGKFLMRKAGNPIVILLDMKLRKGNGLSVLKYVKTHPDLQTIPVVILTSSREEKDVDSCYKNGANAYVVKPVDFHEFVDVVKRLGVFWALVNEPLLENEQ